MNIDLDEYKKNKEYFDKINDCSVFDLEFFRNGKKIKLNNEKAIREEWLFTGLDTKSFIDLEVLYKY